MCGIVGYVGERDPLEMCLSGLKQLEYRGYDSAGIAGICEGVLKSCKEAGKIVSLEKKVRLENFHLELAIGHTRWATHGEPTHRNAHPHFDRSGDLALVHNGIIENYESLKGLLEGVPFSSETDSEVIVQLIGKFYKGDLLRAVQETTSLLKGSFAIAVIHKSHKEIVVASHDCPLCIGFGAKETMIASDLNAFSSGIKHVVFLKNGETARVWAGGLDAFEGTDPISKKREPLESEFTIPSKGNFEHYLVKEIFEQDRTVQRLLREPLQLDQKLLSAQNIWILGCGTSAHAAALGALYFEDFAHIGVNVEIASEARYRNLRFGPDTLVIAISQSGETADTIAAAREAKRKGCKILGICNVKNSTLSRESDHTLFLHAGPEISVCSTKAFSAEVALLLLFILQRAKGEAEQILSEFGKIPSHIQQVLQKASALRTLAKKYAHFEHFFFTGRRYMVPTCMEAALKLKELSYVNANGYPAGELKHGPIALISRQFPVVAFCANRQTQEKLLSNLMEVKARGAPILAFAPEDFPNIEAVADDVFWLPPTIDSLAPFSSTVASQLFAYFVAEERGCDIDQPRNLAKSVTVE